MEENQRGKILPSVKKYILLSLILSVLVVFGYVIAGNPYVLFLLPLVIFISLHYSNIWGILKRLKYGIPVIIFALILQAVVLTPITYSDPGTLHYSNNSGESFNLTFSPYTASDGNFTIYANFSGLPGGHFKPVITVYSVFLGFINTVINKSLNNVSETSGFYNLSYNLGKLPSGAMETEITLNYTNMNVSTGFVRGPINLPEYSYLFFIFTNYVFLYFFITLLYIVGLFIARSVSNASRFRSQMRNQQNK